MSSRPSKISVNDRHATELLAKGLPLLEISKRLGHSKPTHTLNLYGHSIKGYDEKIVEQVISIYL